MSVRLKITGTTPRGGRGQKPSAVAHAMRARVVALRGAFDSPGNAPLMRAVGATVENSTRRRFFTNTAPDGTPWQPSERALAEGGRTLVDTGILRDSIHYTVQPDSVTIGTAISYATRHQTGRYGAIPRPFFGLSTADRTAINRLVARHADREFRA